MLQQGSYYFPLRIALVALLLLVAMLMMSCYESNRTGNSDGNEAGEWGGDDDDTAGDDDDSAGDDDDSAGDDDDTAGDDDDTAGDDDDTAGDDDDSAGDDDDTAGDDDDTAGDDDDTLSGCETSPVVGTWQGTFEGSVQYTLTGQEDVDGPLSFDINCTDRLAIDGDMTGADDGGATFSATIDGDYSQSTDSLDATLVGTITLGGSVPYTLNFTGDFDGDLVQSSPYVINGNWQISVPLPVGSGTGSGTWEAQLQ